MQAIVLQSFGEPMMLTDVERPSAGLGQVLGQIEASGVNPLDTKIAAGKDDHARIVLPTILGIDMAGVVDAVGDNVVGFQPGDKVYGMTSGVAGVQGALAQHAAVDAELLAYKPKHMSMREAAVLSALALRYLCMAAPAALATSPCRSRGHLAHRSMRLVRPASVPSSKEMARPPSTSGRAPRKTISSATPVAKASTSYDTAGGTTLHASFRAARLHVGHVVSCLGWGTHALAPLSFRTATYSGVFTLLPLIRGKGRNVHGPIMCEATGLVEAGKTVVLLDPTTFTLADVTAAHGDLVDAKANGKLVISLA